MFKSSFAYTRQASRHKSQARSKSVAARLPPSERTLSPQSASRSLAAVAAASASVADPASADDDNEFQPKDYKEEVMKLIEVGIKKWLKFMPALPKNRLAEWDLPTLLAQCGGIYDSLDPSIRLIPSHPSSLLQRKKTLACNIAFSCCPYNDVNQKKTRAEFNRLFGAQRNGPTRLTDKYVPEEVKARVAKMAKKKGDVDME